MSNCAGSEPFALQVLGDSMEPEFPNGCIIIVEPGGVLIDGCFVVANHDDDVVLRKLRMNENSWRLIPLNSEYQEHSIEDRAQIRGRVIQRAGKRRTERKTYL